MRTLHSVTGRSRQKVRATRTPANATRTPANTPRNVKSDVQGAKQGFTLPVPGSPSPGVRVGFTRRHAFTYSSRWAT